MSPAFRYLPALLVLLDADEKIECHVLVLIIAVLTIRREDTIPGFSGCCFISGKNPDSLQSQDPTFRLYCVVVLSAIVYLVSAN